MAVDSHRFSSVTTVFSHLMINKKHVTYCLMIVYLFKDEGIEDNHAEIVDNEGFAELEGLSVLHVFGPQPEE